MSISYEQLEKLLQYEAIEDLQIGAKDSESFERIFKFTIEESKYQIIWWSNICYLYSQGLIITFENLDINSNCPNRYKENLVFQGPDKRTLAVIGLVPI